MRFADLAPLLEAMDDMPAPAAEREAAVTMLRAALYGVTRELGRRAPRIPAPEPLPPIRITGARP